MLDFKGRTLKSSINNCVIADLRINYYHLIFAKAGEEFYNSDVSYPFSFIQGIAVAISRF